MGWLLGLSLDGWRSLCHSWHIASTLISWRLVPYTVCLSSLLWFWIGTAVSYSCLSLSDLHRCLVNLRYLILQILSALLYVKICQIGRWWRCVLLWLHSWFAPLADCILKVYHVASFIRLNSILSWLVNRGLFLNLLLCLPQSVFLEADLLLFFLRL